MDEQRPWHRLFGLSWTDFFRGLPVTVEPEKDLSVKKQLLDIVLLRKDGEALNCKLPDGFEELAAYNLVSFKSHREKLAAWTLQELLGHYVNLRKQVSPSMDVDDLLAPDDFRLFAVCVRYPRTLVDDNVSLIIIKPGVYEVEALGRRICVVVVNELPQQENNALLHLFSTKAELLAYGAQHYRIRSAESSTLLFDLLQRFKKEVQAMPDLLEEFARETIDRMLKELPIEKRLEGVSVTKRLEGVSMEELLTALTPQDREALAEALAQRKPNGHKPASE